MLMPVFCIDDPQGPLSQAEALELLKKMHTKFMEELAETQVLGPDDSALELDRRRRFEFACGAEQALEWAIDLVERLTLDPEMSRTALLKTAELLEYRAAQLRESIKKS